MIHQFVADLDWRKVHTNYYSPLKGIWVDMFYGPLSSSRKKFSIYEISSFFLALSCRTLNRKTKRPIFRLIFKCYFIVWTMTLIWVDKRGRMTSCLFSINAFLCMCERPLFLAHWNKGTKEISKEIECVHIGYCD